MKNWTKELEKYLNKSFKNIKLSSIISGKIIKISDKYAFVDIGSKKEALLSVEKFKKNDGTFILKEENEIQALITGKSSQDEFWILSFKKLREKSLWEDLRRAYKEKRTIKVKNLALNKGGYEVEFEDFIKGFIPFSQAFFRNRPENFLIGETVEVEILEIKKGNFIASRKELLEKEYKKKKDTLIEKIKNGEPLEGTGYLPYRELDWKRIDNPSDYLKIDEKIKVKVLNYDPIKEKLKLSIKALLPDPWEEVSQKYKEGQIVKGKVTKILNFRAFIELEPGIEGFIPGKEITWNRKVKINEILEENTSVSALILEIKPSGRKVLLSLRKLEPDPWVEASKIYKVGDIVEGVIEKFLPQGLIEKYYRVRRI
ncbi:hypothetical protein DRN73_08840 [Candidatus Pacearchaeota archaeon]|nr:MAG: hypothetical protein DRN73_08840 [Candidatus Pacearchaeota archaeon]